MTGDPWAEVVRPGYRYPSTLRRYKTDTLVRKWREDYGDAQQRAALAYELSFRDPVLALAEVRARLADPGHRRQHRTLRLCLHHVADAPTARELLEGEDFDPSALHLAAYAALLEDFLAALPARSAEDATEALRRLGFLAGPAPSPILDPGEADGPGAGARYAEVLTPFLCAAFSSARLAAVRPELAEHLRRTGARQADVFLLGRYAEGQLSAIAAFSALPRLGWERARAAVGGAAVDRLVAAFLVELAGPPRPFEAAALDHAGVPGGLRELPAEVREAVARAILAEGRFASRHPAAAAVLRGADRAADPGLVDHALALLDEDAGRACALLAEIARDAGHPRRELAFAHLCSLGRAAPEPVRRHALHRLGEVGDARATPILLEALDDPALRGARLLVVTALALAADARALPTLERLREAGPGVDHAIEQIAARSSPRDTP